MTGLAAALTIAGSDPTGGAGVQRDLATFAACGVRGMSAITAVTAQDASGVHAVYPVAPAIVEAQIASVVAAGPIAAAKTGMLANASVVAAVARALRANDIGPLVVDPVINASAGGTLLDDGGVRFMIERLLPLARAVTPNIAEAERLAGFPIRTVEDQAKACEAIRGLGARAVVVTGGHAGDARSCDVVDDGGAVSVLDAERIPGGERLHGTGCMFSATLTASLARGDSLEEAAMEAKQAVRRWIEAELG